MIVGLELHLLQVEHDVSDILDHARQGRELMLRPGDFYRCNCRAFERRKQHAPERIPDSVSVTGLKRLGCELGISVCSCVLVFDEGFRHLKTTVTNWHNFYWSDGVLQHCRKGEKDTKAITPLFQYSIVPCS